MLTILKHNCVEKISQIGLRKSGNPHNPNHTEGWMQRPLRVFGLSAVCWSTWQSETVESKTPFIMFNHLEGKVHDVSAFYSRFPFHNSHRDEIRGNNIWCQVKQVKRTSALKKKKKTLSALLLIYEDVWLNNWLILLERPELVATYQ